MFNGNHNGSVDKYRLLKFELHFVSLSLPDICLLCGMNGRWHSKRDFIFTRQWFRGQDGTYSK